MLLNGQCRSFSVISEYRNDSMCECVGSHHFEPIEHFAAPAPLYPPYVTLGTTPQPTD